MLAMSEVAREAWEITSIGEWLQRRQRDVTCSRLPALFDEHPYMTRDSLAEVMRGDTSTGGSINPPGNASMRRGRIFEAAVASAATDEKPEWQLTKANTYHSIPSLRFGGTPDYWLTSPEQPGRGLLEIKTARPSVWEKWHGRPPLGYLIQTLGLQVVTGAAWGWLAVMVMSDSFPVHYFSVPRHPEAERRILAAVAAWWAAFDAGELPGTAAGAAELEAAFDDGSHVDLSDNNYLRTALPAREELKAYLKATERQIDEIDAALKAAMGTAATAWLPGYSITWKTQRRRETVIAARDIRVLRVRAVDEQETADAPT